jgi:hypothetical protein
MHLVLASTDDVAALWAYENLRRRDGGNWKIVSTETLSFAIRWEHRVSQSGTSTGITLADGTMIESEALDGVLNRLMVAPSPPVRFGIESDQSYAAYEFSALQMSWLAGLNRVINPPSPQGLAGAWRDPLEWKLLAARAGLTEAAVGSAPGRQVIIIGLRVCGADVPDEVRAASLALARLSATPLLGVGFTTDWAFVEATVYPDLRTGGVDVIDALIEALS